MKYLITLFFAVFFGISARAETVLVLDASNSMWGEIDQVPKINLAKDAVSGLLDEWDLEQPLGLVAYGHRDARSCGDSELLVQPGASIRALKRATNSIFPLGRTPLTDAMMMASKTLLQDGFTNPNVILLTDGAENCGRDLCAFAEILGDNRPDFRVHVVGFDLNKEERGDLFCLADQTGGLGFIADTPSELRAALHEVRRLIKQRKSKWALGPNTEDITPAGEEALRSLLATHVIPASTLPALTPQVAKAASANAEFDDLNRRAPSRLLQERSRETVAQSLIVTDSLAGATDAEDETIDNASVFSFGSAKVSFQLSLSQDLEPTEVFDRPVWSLYAREGQARGRQILQTRARIPSLELPLGDYFMVLEAEHIRFNYGFTVQDTLPDEHVIPLNLGYLEIHVENQDVLDVLAFRFERGPDNPSLEVEVRGPWSHSILLPEGTYIVQGRMQDRRSTVGPLQIMAGKTTSASVLVQ